MNISFVSFDNDDLKSGYFWNCRATAAERGVSWHQRRGAVHGTSKESAVFGVAAADLPAEEAPLEGLHHTAHAPPGQHSVQLQQRLTLCCCWSRRFPSPGAAAAHAASFVAAVLLVLPYPILAAAALIFDVVWDHLVKLCQHVWLAAAASWGVSGGTASRSKPLIGPRAAVARWAALLPPASTSSSPSSRKGATESARTTRHCQHK